jgi:hypothetical protein
MVQGTSTDRYASLLLIYAVKGGICHLSGQLGTPEHLQHGQGSSSTVTKAKSGKPVGCWCNVAYIVV